MQPIEYIAEAVYPALHRAITATLTGRIDYAAPFLKELALEPAALI